MYFIVYRTLLFTPHTYACVPVTAQRHAHETTGTQTLLQGRVRRGPEPLRDAFTLPAALTSELHGWAGTAGRGFFLFGAFAS